jgi:hypothetical protein
VSEYRARDGGDEEGRNIPQFLDVVERRDWASKGDMESERWLDLVFDLDCDFDFEVE